MVLLPPSPASTEIEARLDAIVHYICAFVDNPAKLGATKLNKILWYSDVYSFIECGATITRAIYQKQKFGPVPKGIMGSRFRLTRDGKIVEREAPFYGYAQTQFIALTKPDISLFSANDIAVIDGVATAISDEHSAASISAATHDAVWQCAAIGEEIPIWAVLGANFEDATSEDVAWVETNKADLLAQMA